MSISSGSDVTIPMHDSPPPPPSPYRNHKGMPDAETGGSRVAGIDNQGYQDASSLNDNGKKTCSEKSTSQTEIPMEQYSEAGSPKVTEAVNTEVVQGHSVLDSIPHKPQAEFGPYEKFPEYFISVNQHKKFFTRGEKLSVTKDKRRGSKKFKKCLCWLLGGFLLAAIIAVAVLVAVGLIPEKTTGGTYSMVEMTTSIGPDEDSTKFSSTESDIMSSSLPTEASEKSTDITAFSNYVPNAANIELRFRDEIFEDELEDETSLKFKALAATVENLVKQKVEAEDEVDLAAAHLIQFKRGSIVAKLRIGWSRISVGEETPDFTKIQNLVSRWTEIGNFTLDRGTVVDRLYNSCKLSNGGCSHACAFDESMLQFVCTCPEDKFLDNDKKTCVNTTTQVITDETTSTEPPASAQTPIEFPESSSPLPVEPIFTTTTTLPEVVADVTQAPAIPTREAPSTSPEEVTPTTEEGAPITPELIISITPEEVTPITPIEVTPVTPEEVTPIAPIEVTPITPEEVTPIPEAESTSEAPVQVTPIPPEEVTPVVSEVTPIALEEVTPVPVVSEEVTPIALEEVTPIVQVEVTPIASIELTPITPEEVTPVEVTPITQDITTRTPELVTTEEVTPRTPDFVTPTISEDVTPRIADLVTPITSEEVTPRNEEEASPVTVESSPSHDHVTPVNDETTSLSPAEYPEQHVEPVGTVMPRMLTQEPSTSDLVAEDQETNVTEMHVVDLFTPRSTTVQVSAGESQVTSEVPVNSGETGNVETLVTTTGPLASESIADNNVTPDENEPAVTEFEAAVTSLPDVTGSFTAENTTGRNKASRSFDSAESESTSEPLVNRPVSHSDEFMVYSDLGLSHANVSTTMATGTSSNENEMGTSMSVEDSHEVENNGMMEPKQFEQLIDSRGETERITGIAAEREREEMTTIMPISLINDTLVNEMLENTTEDMNSEMLAHANVTNTMVDINNEMLPHSNVTVAEDINNEMLPHSNATATEDLSRDISQHSNDSSLEIGEGNSGENEGVVIDANASGESGQSLGVTSTPNSTNTEAPADLGAGTNSSASESGRDDDLATLLQEVHSEMSTERSIPRIDSVDPETLNVDLDLPTTSSPEGPPETVTNPPELSENEVTS